MDLIIGIGIGFGSLMATALAVYAFEYHTQTEAIPFLYYLLTLVGAFVIAMGIHAIIV